MNTKPERGYYGYQADLKQMDKMRLDILLQQAPTAIAVNFFGSLIVLAALLSSEVPTLFLQIWIGLSLSVNVCRLYVFRHIQKHLTHNTPATKLLQYENIFAGWMFAGGLVWGALGLTYFYNLSVQHQIIIPLVVAGMSSGAFFSYWSSFKSLLSYSMAALIPLGLCLFFNGLQIESMAVSLYLLAIIGLVIKLHQRLLESLYLSHENSALVTYLTNVNKAQSDLLLEIEAKETFLHHTFEQAGIPMMLIDKKLDIIDVNKAGRELFGFSKDEFLHMKANQLLHPDEKDAANQQIEQLINGRITQYNVTRRCINKSGRHLWLQVRVAAVRNEQAEIEYIVVQAQDVTEQYELNENLQYVLDHDNLTGLPNRIALEKQIRALLSRDEVSEHVLCYIDLDQFNLINDTYGHHVGDTMLMELAKLFRTTLKREDILARFSGDEFAILMVDSDIETSQEKLNNLLNRIRLFSFVVDDVTLNITASIGVVPVNSSSCFIELLKNADCACHVAKEMGRDRLHIFHERDISTAQRSGEMHWVARIQRALNENRFVLYSQPIVTLDAEPEQRAHCELLIRMRDDDGSIIAPGNFLPAAERYNLAAAIDVWTVSHVLERLSSVRKEGRDISGIYAINLSGQSLGDARFYERIIGLIQYHQLYSSDAVLCFEITETAAISNMHSALLFMNELRQFGCMFALDDFGRGLSSFAYLKQLPVDFLKIDGMFVRDIAQDPVNLEFVSSMNGIGQVLGLKTIAEFVENEALEEKMRDIGVDMVQGYYLGKPTPWQI